MAREYLTTDYREVVVSLKMFLAFWLEDSVYFIRLLI